jgi:hypothetical protein
VRIAYWHEDHSFLVTDEDGAVKRVSAYRRTDGVPFLAPSFASDGRKKALRLRVDNSRNRRWVLDTDRV